VEFARALGLAFDASLRLLALTLYALTALFAAHALRIRKFSPRLSLLLITAVLALGLSMPQSDFGQREHLLTALLLPYLCTATAEVSEPPVPCWLRSSAGLLLGLGLALKPHYLLVPLALFVVRLRRRTRRLIIEDACAGLFVAAYLGLVVVGAREYLDNVLPLAGTVYYQAYGRSLLNTLVEGRSAEVTLLAAWLVTAAASWRGTRSVEERFAVSLCAASSACLVAFLVQRTGWHYQSAPARVTSGVALVYALGLALRSRLPRYAAFARR